MIKSVFEKMMVRMAPPGEGPKDKVEMKGADAAKAKLEEKMPKLEMTHDSPEKEAKRNDGAARADVIAIFKQGKKFDSSVPGLDKDTLKKVKESLSKLPNGSDRPMSTKRMNVTVTVEEKGVEVEKSLFFVSIADGTKSAPNDVSYFYKVGEDFEPNSREMVSSYKPDEKMLDLVGANSPAAKERMEERKRDFDSAKKELDQAKEERDKAISDKKLAPTDENKDKAVKRTEVAFVEATKKFDLANKAYADYQKNFALALSGKKVGESKSA